MKEDWWSKIEEIFNRAVILPKNEQYKFVDKLCIADHDLRDEILALLSEDERDYNALNHSVFNLGVNLLDEELEDILNEPHFSSYRLKKLIGRGGMGAVFLAEDTRLERLVAIKIMPLEFSSDTELAKRFQQEAKTASLVSHPNVAHIYDFGLHKGRYFLVMEYIKGKTLREIMNSQTQSLKELCEVGLELAKALKFIHQQGIIHRDIKPENIVISNDRVLKLLDFGLAKFHHTATFHNCYDSGREKLERTSLQTTPGILIGTPAYMSPEQIRGQPLDERTDIWSLGAVLYEIVTGERPFDGETKSDIHAAILLSEPKPIANLIELPKIKVIVENCLRKDVGERIELTKIIRIFRETLRKMGSESRSDKRNFPSLNWLKHLKSKFWRR